MPEWKHVHLLATPGLLKAIDRWGKKFPVSPDRNQAIRYLLTQALKAEGIEVQDDDESGQAQD